jgi:hypothetical protein
MSQNQTSSNNFDNGQVPFNNVDNNVGNDEWDVVIRKEDLKRLNDPNCTHKNVVRDDSDTIGDAVAWVCKGCGRGTFLPKHITKIT